MQWVLFWGLLNLPREAQTSKPQYQTVEDGGLTLGLSRTGLIEAGVESRGPTNGHSSTIKVWVLSRHDANYSGKNLGVALAFDPDHADGITPPYLVYLKSDYLPCTGVLVHPLWVITAASCNLPRLHMILGVTNPSNLTERNVQVVGYEKMIHHPHFSITSIENNLMLIKLNRYVELNDYVRPVGLPSGLAPEDTTCMVSTWAYNLCDVYKDPNSLQNVNVSIISETRCHDGYKTQHIKKNMLCLGIVPGRRQPCKEVTAAPAVCNGILQGILTFADGCILRADVGIYTKIFSYMPWIENTIQNN